VQIIPAIDLRGGRCVRLAQGQKDKSKIYSDDPVAVAQHFAGAGAELVHIVDLDGAFSEGQSLNHSIVKEIVERVQVPIQFGGGLRTIDDVETLIEQGVTRVVLGTLATKSAATLKDLVDRFGSKICVGIDARNGVVMVNGWQAATSMSILDFAVAIARLGVERIIYTDIERDGMLSGPNIEQTVTVARQAGVHVTASGGVSRLEDIQKLREAGEPLIDSVIVGRALYEKRFTLEEALQAAIR
jgi:phosphoribosylformimino-5-aminoimidazole carboxamide ribotide isomerase